MRCVVLLMGLLCSASSYAQDQFELFTVVPDAITQTVKNVTVYHVAQGDQLLKQLNASLKTRNITNEADAVSLITEEFKRAITNQSIGLAKAAKYKLKYFPAIVINGKAVLYGTTDIAEVRAHVQ